MTVLGHIAILAANTLREAVRNRLLYTLLFFAIALIGAAVLLSTLSYVESERILQDIGFATMRLFAVAIAIFVGVGLIHKEVERRTVYTILSNVQYRVGAAKRRARFREARKVGDQAAGKSRIQN